MKKVILLMMLALLLVVPSLQGARANQTAMIDELVPAYHTTLKKYGYMNLSGKIIIPHQFETANKFSNSLAAVKVNGKYGYINKTGQFIIPPQFGEAGDFSEGVAVVSDFGKKDQNGNYIIYSAKYGYINQKGQYIAKPQFMQASTFSKGVAAVRTFTNGCGFIDASGKYIVKPQKSYTSCNFYPDSGYLEVSAEEKMWFDLKGKMVFKSPHKLFYSYGRTVGPQIQPIPIEKKYGYINKSGVIVIPAIYDAAQRFSEGLAPVRFYGTPWRFINEKGEVVIPPTFAQIHNGFSEGMAAVNPEGSIYWGYINKAGEYVIQPQYLDATDFQNGIAKVKIRNTGEGSEMIWGLINQKGETILEPTYYAIYDFSEGLAQVQVNPERSYSNEKIKAGYIDTSGKLVIPAIYDPDPNLRFKQGLAIIKKNGLSGVIDKSGKVIIPTNFTSIDFDEGKKIILALIWQDNILKQEYYNWEGKRIYRSY